MAAGNGLGHTPRSLRRGSPVSVRSSAGRFGSVILATVQIAYRLADVSQRPGLYAMYGGGTPRPYVAYVGIAGGLQGRLAQHFVQRNSSVTTGTSATSLNIDYVTQVHWWDDPRFADETTRHAAELVAFRVLDPALRSRGAARKAATEMAGAPEFVAWVEGVLASPSGRYTPPRLDRLTTMIEELLARVEVLEKDAQVLRDE